MNSTRSHKAFSMIDLLLIIAALAGIFLVILPLLARSRTPASKASCSNHLKQVGLAFRLWAGDSNDKFPMHTSSTNGGVMETAQQGSAYDVFLIMSNELYTPKVLFCPEESNRKRIAASVFSTITSNGTTPFTATNNISYFVGLDAMDSDPSTFLSGDDHFSVSGTNPSPGLFLLPTNAPVEWRTERHPKQGNVALADGSVQGFSTTAFRAALVQTGLATNRLAMP